MKIITEFLEKLGFGDESADLFVALTKHGPLTLLEASRRANLERTKLYRLVDELKNKGLIEEIPAYKRRTIKAASLSTLEMMVREKEINSQSLSGNLPAFSQALGTLSQNIPTSNVTYYRGVEGLKQMTWRILRCRGLWRTYSYSFWEEIFDTKFVLEMDNRMNEMKLKCHNLYSEQFVNYRQKWLSEHTQKPVGKWLYLRSRLISEKLLKINQNIEIYNDTVAYSYWDNNQIFGVEIEDARVAQFHKQIHEMLWKSGKKMQHLAWMKHPSFSKF